MIRRMFSRSLYVGTMTSARSRAGSDDTSAVDEDASAERQEREQHRHDRHGLSLRIRGIVEVEADPGCSRGKRNAEEGVVGADGGARRPAVDAHRPARKIILGHDE